MTLFSRLYALENLRENNKKCFTVSQSMTEQTLKLIKHQELNNNCQISSPTHTTLSHCDRGLKRYTNNTVGWLVGWLVVLRIYVASAVFQPYRDLEAGDNQSLKIQVARPGIEPGRLAPQAKSLTTQPLLLPKL